MFKFLWNIGYYSCIGNGRKEGSSKGKSRESNNQNSDVARSFTFKELTTATQNFRETNLIGEGGFGCVYKGRLDSGLASFLLSKFCWFNSHLSFLTYYAPMVNLLCISLCN